MISVDPDPGQVVLRIDDDKGVKMTLTRSSVARVLEAAVGEVDEAPTPDTVPRRLADTAPGPIDRRRRPPLVGRDLRIPLPAG